MKTLICVASSRPPVTCLRVSLFGDACAWRERGEVEEVPLVLRQIPHLLGRNVRGDLGPPRLNQSRRADDFDRLGVDNVGADLEIGSHGLTDEDLNGLGLRLVLRHDDRDLVGRGPQARQVEGSLRVADGFVGESRLRVLRGDRGAGKRARVVRDGALDRRARALRRDRGRDGGGEDEEYQPCPASLNCPTVHRMPPPAATQTF
jgi:hypothetical protein